MDFVKNLSGASQARKSAGKVTAEELLDLPPGYRSELVDGEILDLSPQNAEHGSLVSNLTVYLGSFLKAHDLGNLGTGDVGYRIRSDPDTVRAPDIGFVRKSRIPLEGIQTKFWEIAPDLAVEVVSPSESRTYIESKVRDWLQAGTREVWVVDPRLREVKVHRPGLPAEVLGESDTLESDELLPGFSLKVREIFKL